MLARFAQQYPQVQVELNITNRNVDLVAEGFGLAIRLGQLPDSGLVARTLEDAPLLLVTAPDYLQRRGTPQTLDDLQQHLCLPFVMPRTGRLAPLARPELPTQYPQALARLRRGGWADGRMGGLGGRTMCHLDAA